MALGSGYPGQDCSLARALEVVGARWTMLVLRDCFFGVRRFSDFAAHLDISRAVLTDRLDSLVRAGLLHRDDGQVGHPQYTLTEAGLALWPAVHALSVWGSEYATPEGTSYRVYLHTGCGTRLDPHGRCPSCGAVPAPDQVSVDRNLPVPSRRTDPVSQALTVPRPLLAPVHPRSPGKIGMPESR